MGTELIFRQLYDAASSTYTYLLADARTREAVLIDTVYEQHLRDKALLDELGLALGTVLDTHCHADHIGLLHQFIDKFSLDCACPRGLFILGHGTHSLNDLSSIHN